MLLADLLAHVQDNTVTLSSQSSLQDALSALAYEKTSAVLVMDGLNLQGIFTRSDLVRHLAFDADGRGLENCSIGQAASANLISATAETPLPAAIEKMTSARIEHLPVFEQGRLMGTLHLKTLLNCRIDLLQSEIRHLQEYIELLHDAERD